MTSNRDIQFDERKQLTGTWLHPAMNDAEITNVARTVGVHEAVGADEGRTTPIQDSYTGWWGTDEKKYGDTHHSSGGNYVFFDGHAKWLRPNNVEPCPPNAGWGVLPGPEGPPLNLLPNPNYISGLEPRFAGRQATFCTN
jgi:prepilin-type processing-associated H-X9-DG protein